MERVDGVVIGAEQGAGAGECGGDNESICCWGASRRIACLLMVGLKDIKSLQIGWIAFRTFGQCLSTGGKIPSPPKDLPSLFASLPLA